MTVKDEELKSKFANVDEEYLKKILTLLIKSMPSEKYALYCLSVDGIYMLYDLLLVDFTTDNYRRMCIPCHIEEQNGKLNIILDLKEYKNDLESNCLHSNDFYNSPEEDKEYIWKLKVKKAPKVKHYTLKNFKLEPIAKKYFEYGPMQKQLLKDLTEWLLKGGDAFSENSIDFFGLPAINMADPELYKNDPIHVGDMTDTVKFLADRYKWICSGQLYRGISKAEYEGIMKQLKDGKTIFKRGKVTSFTSNLGHARKFAKYGGGSIVDTKVKRQAGAVITITSKDPLFFIDEYVFYSCMSYNIAELDNSMSLKEAIEHTMFEEEWLVPADYSWKVVDKDNLVFEVSKA